MRGTWRLNKNNVEKFKLVLAHRNGVVVGVFRPEKWLESTKKNFDWLIEDIPHRIGFEGKPAEPAVRDLYLNKRVPDEFRQKGARAPVRLIQKKVST